MTIRCIAVDDEQLALDLLVDNISKVPFLQLVGTAKNAMEVISLLQQETVDLAFLDIQMPGLSGMQLASSLKGRTKVIFLTAYEQFALESYNVNAIDYLVKPVSFDRFLEACMKALDSFLSRSASTQAQPANAVKEEGKYLFVNVEYNIVRILINDVIMIEGYKDYVKIHLASSKRPVITRMSMKHLEEKLLPYDFFRVHKSFIVSLTRIESIQRNAVKLGELEVPVGDLYKDALMERINQRNIL
ncbi:LytR/AlgR family response regulator transcription factor [Flavihumibacter solisilvae]|uniref:Chemotaxis protein CheY n=1 Tax=Flavihumibacter solisilvae TaxID=1349421 RepID=A0A0C1L0G3_9BACT|nr:LytTR family DNA-binding domain-containing protein [Flavihumibacter solisilvae]KIC93011.1 chemotaxis protein CheY [Flavihumibacter solisilvae]